MAGLRGIFARSRRDEELERELAFHIEALTQENLARGLDPGDARRRAILEFGGSEQVKQQMREVHVSRIVESRHYDTRQLCQLDQPRYLRSRNAQRFSYLFL